MQVIKIVIGTWATIVIIKAILNHKLIIGESGLRYFLIHEILYGLMLVILGLAIALFF